MERILNLIKSAAIYARKSIYTLKGESINNQIEMCKQYLLQNKIENFFVYKDEGFSGKNTNRPSFKKMLAAAKMNKFQIIICYRLDRISRNIADFSSLIEHLKKYNISFISIKEQFDTLKPMGRAMMYIASVFSQLERETISERIRDNMLELSKMGRWLGGKVPTGFKSQCVNICDEYGSIKNLYTLYPIESEIFIVKLIFKKYIEKRSLSKVAQFLLDKNIKTKERRAFTKVSICTILKNPVYVKTTDEVIAYLKSCKINVIGSADGIHGMLSYNKREGKSGPYRNKKYWIYAVAPHSGIIEGNDWVKVQCILSQNASSAPRLGKSKNALLCPLIKCAKCKNPLRIIYGTKNKNGKINYYYTCSKCKNKNVNGELIENTIVDNLNKFILPKDLLILNINYSLQSLIYKSEHSTIEKKLRENQLSSENLIKKLQLTDDIDVSRLLLSKLSYLEKERKEFESYKKIILILILIKSPISKHYFILQMKT